MCTPRASASTSSGCAYSRSIRSRTRRSSARSRRCCASADVLVTSRIVPQSTGQEPNPYPSCAGSRPRSRLVPTTAPTSSGLRSADHPPDSACAERAGASLQDRVQRLLPLSVVCAHREGFTGGGRPDAVGSSGLGRADPAGSEGAARPGDTVGPAHPDDPAGGRPREPAGLGGDPDQRPEPSVRDVGRRGRTGGQGGRQRRARIPDQRGPSLSGRSGGPDGAGPEGLRRRVRFRRHRGGAARRGAGRRQLRDLGGPASGRVRDLPQGPGSGRSGLPGRDPGAPEERRDGPRSGAGAGGEVAAGGERLHRRLGRLLAQSAPVVPSRRALCRAGHRVVDGPPRRGTCPAPAHPGVRPPAAGRAGDGVRRRGGPLRAPRDVQRGREGGDGATTPGREAPGSPGRASRGPACWGRTASTGARSWSPSPTTPSTRS